MNFTNLFACICLIVIATIALLPSEPIHASPAEPTPAAVIQDNWDISIPAAEPEAPEEAAEPEAPVVKESLTVRSGAFGGDGVLFDGDGYLIDRRAAAAGASDGARFPLARRLLGVDRRQSRRAAGRGIFGYCR